MSSKKPLDYAPPDPPPREKLPLLFWICTILAFGAVIMIADWRAIERLKRGPASPTSPTLPPRAVVPTSQP